MRAWLLGALVLIALAIHSIWASVHASMDQNWLFTNGTPVQATIFAGGRGRVPGIPYPPDGSFSLIFPWHGKPATVETSFPEKRDVIMSGTNMMLYIDPNDPTHWTSRSTIFQWWSGLTASIVLLVVTAVLLLMAYRLRSQRLRWYEVGEAIDAVVVDTTTPPLAPLSQVVRCTEVIEDSSATTPATITATIVAPHRAMFVYLPRSAGKVRKGDLVSVIRVPNRPDRAIAAAAYR